MRISVVTALAATAVLAGCGQQVADGSSSDPAARQWRDCTPAAFEGDAGQSLDVSTADGPVPVKLPTSGPCAGGLVALTPAGVVGTDVDDLDLDESTVQVVGLRGDGGPAALVRVDGERHPRGGFQPHLFTVAGGTVAEVTVDGGPLLPFVATDGGMAPMTATCDDGEVAVLSATVSEPPGIVLAWDVERTAYRIEGASAELVGSEQVRDHAADPVLRQEMPELFEPGSLFADC